MAIIGNIPYFQTNPYTHFLHVIVLMLHSNCRSKKPCSSKLVGGFTPLKHIAMYTDVYSHYNELAEYIFWTTDQVSLVVHPNMFSTVSLSKGHPRLSPAESPSCPWLPHDETWRISGLRLMTSDMAKPGASTWLKWFSTHSSYGIIWKFLQHVHRHHKLGKPWARTPRDAPSFRFLGKKDVLV